jgi:hypothetical protein
MRVAITLGTWILAATLAACSKDASKAAPVTSSAAAALDVAVTPTGEAQVSLTDDKGQPAPTAGVTGRVELADGDTVPLTPAEDGKTLTAPLAEHFEKPGHGCMAKVRVTMPGGAERSTEIDLCREHAKHRGGAGHPGEPHGPGGMGPGGMGSGGMEHGRGD